MIKVLWFLKRAEGLSLSSFRSWWLEHAQDVLMSQSPHLHHYVVNIRSDIGNDLPGTPDIACEWDGVAEQWFKTREDFEAAYDRPASPTRSDTLAHTSKFTRLIVDEAIITQS
jgi:hypothetical protein